MPGEKMESMTCRHLQLKGFSCNPSPLGCLCLGTLTNVQKDPISKISFFFFFLLKGIKQLVMRLLFMISTSNRVSIKEILLGLALVHLSLSLWKPDRALLGEIWLALESPWSQFSVLLTCHIPAPCIFPVIFYFPFFCMFFFLNPWAVTDPFFSSSASSFTFFIPHGSALQTISQLFCTA